MFQVSGMRKVSCGNRILSEEQIKNAALTAMNLVVEHPELAQEVQKESAAVETPKYRKLTRQIEELLQIEEFSAEEIKHCFTRGQWNSINLQR